MAQQYTFGCTVYQVYVAIVLPLLCRRLDIHMDLGFNGMTIQNLLLYILTDYVGLDFDSWLFSGTAQICKYHDYQ